jgi:hypothetical protein
VSTQLAYDPATSIFGQIVTGQDVEQWCLEELSTWSSTYLAEVERQAGLPAGSLARVKSWVVAASFDQWPEDQLPRGLLVSVGLSELPLRSGDGSYNARWQMGLGVVVSSRTEAETHRLAMLYVAAHRTLLIQRPSLGGRALGVVWQDENYDQLPFDDVRSLGAGMANFTVEVENVATWGLGPNTPDVPISPDDTVPWPPYQEVQTHTETVEHYPPPEPLPED